MSLNSIPGKVSVVITQFWGSGTRKDPWLYLVSVVQIGKLRPWEARACHWGRQPASLQPESRTLKAPLQTHASLSYKSSVQPDYSSLEHLIGDVSTSALASSTDLISTWVQWVMCIVHTQLCDDASKLVELSQKAGTGELTQRFHPGITWVPSEAAVCTPGQK